MSITVHVSGGVVMLSSGVALRNANNGRKLILKEPFGLANEQLP
jgi:hypothetical protein